MFCPLEETLEGTLSCFMRVHSQHFFRTWVSPLHSESVRRCSVLDWGMGYFFKKSFFSVFLFFFKGVTCNYFFISPYQNKHVVDSNVYTKM